MNKPLPVPEPDAQNPLPIVLAKDGVVVLSYKAFVAHTDVHIIVSFRAAYAHRFGPPERDKRGVFEVKDSAWIRDSFSGKGKHFVFTFPDAVFECAADDYASETVDEDDDAVRLMSRRLYK